MIRVEAIQDFTLKDFDELRNIKRASARNKHGELYLGDNFECDKKTVDYLMGKNEEGVCVVKIVELEPEAPKEKPKKAKKC